MSNAQRLWNLLPSEALKTIFTFLTLRERCSASATCSKWRELFFLPIFWRHLNLVLSTRKDGARSEFFSEIACYIKYLEITWPYPWTIDQRNLKHVSNTRPVDKDIANNLKVFFQALSKNTCLKSVIIKFENSASHDEQFCDVVAHCLSKILINCRGLEFVSFGYHPLITWMKLASVTARVLQLSNVEELHISSPTSIAPFEASNKLGSLQLCKNDVCNFKDYNKLRTLSINWIDVTPDLIGSLCAREGNATSMQKLIIYLHKHENCHLDKHPSKEEWQKFTSLNPNLKISFVILKELVGVCASVKNIVGNVHMLKFLECDEIPETPYSNLMTWFQKTLEAHVYVSTKKPIDLTNGESLYGHALVCKNLKYISILGYYIEDSDLLTVAQSFPKLEQLTVTKAHILTSALATVYMVPVSGAKYTRFQAQMSGYLKKPWKALTNLPFDQLFFTEGKDDEFYLTGRFNSCQGSQSY